MFEEYIKEEMRKGAVDFTFRPRIDEHGNLTFYVHPVGRDGQTADWTVNGSVILHTPPFQGMAESNTTGPMTFKLPPGCTGHTVGSISLPINLSTPPTDKNA